LTQEINLEKVGFAVTVY